MCKNKKEKEIKEFDRFKLEFNDEQKALSNIIKDKSFSIVFCEGGAGTGKNFVSIATAMNLHKEKKYENLYYTRSPIVVGSQVETLEISDDKFDPFMCPLIDSLKSIAAKSKKKVKYEHLLKQWELIPMSYIRGRNLNGILIVDEAQNLSLSEIQTLCTRINEGSKIIFIGSLKQIDSSIQKRKNKCDYQVVMESFTYVPYVKMIKLEKSMRSPWCTEIDTLFGNLKNN